MGTLRLSILLGLLVIPVISFAGSAREYSISLAQMPVSSESAEKGVLVDLMKAIGKETGSPVSIDVYPFARSVENVLGGKADIHVPMIEDPETPEEKLPYALSTVTLFHVNFVLYSNRNKPLDVRNLGQYKLETDRAHLQYFHFPIEPSSQIESSLKKVDAGRIDGFIFADSVSDPVLRAGKLANIRRQLYKVYNVKAILPKGGKGGATDKFLSDAVARLRASGAYDRIIAPLEFRYDDWQP